MSEEPNDKLARKQVDAFMAHLSERLQVDESSLRKIAANQQRNGRVYVTWAVALSAAFGVITWLAADKLSTLDAERSRIQSQLNHVSELQRDVRERLRALEQVVYGKRDHP